MTATACQPAAPFATSRPPASSCRVERLADRGRALGLVAAGSDRARGSLDSVAAFGDLPAGARRRLEDGAVPMEPRDRSLIFAQGDPSDSIYAIVGGDGRVRIGVADRNSKQIMLNLFGAGEIFGEVGVLDGGRRTAEALAEGRLRLLRISAESFRSVLGDTPQLGRALSRVLAERVRHTSVLLRDAVFEPLAGRLARQVLHLAELQGRRTEEGVRLAGRFRQSDLADLLGATPRSIITILNAWRERGLVTYDPLRGMLTVCQANELHELVALETAP